ncbi:MAG: hypothetical protein HC858_07000 [Brachymonas sp.]|nr:hypothetical protein [Brachymonas sp.]NJS36469.1 hypothetical protein [Brachymonas sp.]
MIICVCHRVSDRDIAQMARQGTSFEQLQWELGVATQCGRCEDCARQVHAQCQARGEVAFCHPAPSAHSAVMLQPA